MNKIVRGLSVLGLAGAFLLCSCATNLGPETLPSITTATETSIETEPTETEPTLPPEATEPSSVAVVTDSIVENTGKLSVNGTKIVNSEGEEVVLKGMSTFGIHNCEGFFTEETVKTLAEDWGCTVLRFAMTTEGNSDDYTSNPEKYFNEMCDCINMCIDQDIYVIVDWHILYDGDPNEYKAEAIDFFSRISALYGDKPNVLYEICNEPNGMRYDNESEPVDWPNVVKPYAESLVAAIRANDPDNIIIIGTPTWSQDVDIASASPVSGTNLMYTAHFYAGSHGQELRDKITTARNNGCAVFITEWGTTNDSGKGELFEAETAEWMAFVDENNISWCNWSVGGSNTGSTNVLKFKSQILTVEEKYAGHWCDEFITRSGIIVRNLILGQE